MISPSENPAEANSPASSHKEEDQEWSSWFEQLGEYKEKLPCAGMLQGEPIFLPIGYYITRTVRIDKQRQRQGSDKLTCSEACGLGLRMGCQNNNQSRVNFVYVK